MFSLKVSCGNLTETYTLQVNSVTLSITNPSPVIFIQQIYTGKRFTVSAEIRNQEQTLVLENTNTIFNCSWKLADYYDSNSNQNSYVLGIFNNTSVKGKCIFQGVRVKISGNYKIVMFAEAGGSIMTAETQIYISTMQANFITLSASNYNPTAYFKFELTVKVYSDIDVPYYESVALSVSEDSGSQILGSTTANSNSGYYTFRLYFDTLRTKVLTVTLNANNYYYLAIFGKTTVNVMGEAIKVSMNTTVKFT